MGKKKKKYGHVLHFAEGDCFEWAASIMEQFANAMRDNLPKGHGKEDDDEYAGMKEAIARIEELRTKLTDGKLRKKMTPDDWEDVMMYVHQEVSD
jgi:hypothetical protein